MGPRRRNEAEKKRHALEMRAYRARKSEDPAWLKKEAERVKVSIFDVNNYIL
jgi:hypothetical protein